MQQRVDMDYKYLFFTIILLLSISLNSQIMPSNYGFTAGASLIPAAKLDLNASNSRSYSGSGTTWTSIGNIQYNTTLVNGVTYVENGDFDYMSFDGSNDYVETGKTASNLNIYDTDYTMEAAVRFDNSSQGMVFGTSTTSYRQGLHIGAGSNARVYQGHYAMDGSSANNTLTSDVWYHLMWTFDKSAGEMKMYLDGSLIQTQTGKLSFLGTSNIMLSRYWAYSALDLAYAKVFDSVLSASEISSLYSDYDSVVTKAGYVYGTVNENGTLNLSAPANATITSVSFASYGTPDGSDGNYTTSSCHATNSQTIVESYCVGNNSCSIPASNGVFGDPCGGTPKRLYVKVYYDH